MLKKLFALVVTFSLLSISGQSQTKTNLLEINAIWSKFYQAFEQLDYQLMAEIHSKDLVRVAGGSSISDYQTYIENYRKQFEQSRKNNSTSHIGLRFFERVSTDGVASERGIYELIRNKGTNEEKRYYGQFHVVFKKEKGHWRIVMDYDSSENDTIGKDDYLAAHDIDDINQFSSQK